MYFRKFENQSEINSIINKMLNGVRNQYPFKYKIKNSFIIKMI